MDGASILDDLGFPESGHNSASSLSDPDVYLVEEIALFLLDHAYFQSLITQVIQRETLALVVRQRLQPLIKRYGQDLKKTASNSTHFLVICELTTHARHVA
jgi:hypothetical protein